MPQVNCAVTQFHYVQKHLHAEQHYLYEAIPPGFVILYISSIVYPEKFSENSSFKNPVKNRLLKA